MNNDAKISFRVDKRKKDRFLKILPRHGSVAPFMRDLMTYYEHNQEQVDDFFIRNPTLADRPR